MSLSLSLVGEISRSKKSFCLDMSCHPAKFSSCSFRTAAVERPQIWK